MRPFSQHRSAPELWGWALLRASWGEGLWGEGLPPSPPPLLVRPPGGASFFAQSRHAGARVSVWQ